MLRLRLLIQNNQYREWDTVAVGVVLTVVAVGVVLTVVVADVVDTIVAVVDADTDTTVVVMAPAIGIVAGAIGIT
ncbi:MAG: hypothetical protein OER56_16745, partial [Hyphomicrobiales bacterium]|nr:hypothetical protein [Hyphomicrobiales bacterium]